MSSTQTKLGDYVSSALQDSYDVKISVEKIDLSYLGQVKLKGILIKDHHNDTLIAVSKLQTSLLSAKEVLKNKVDLGSVSLFDGIFNLKTYKGEKKSNLTIFSQKLVKKTKSEKRSFELQTEKIKVYGIDFEIINENRGKDSLTAFYRKIKGDVLDFKLLGSDVYAKLRKVQLVDNHDLEVKNLTTDFSYTLSKMKFVNTELETENSSLKAQMTFDYEAADLQDFNNKVQINATLSKSNLSLVDLKKFYKEFGNNDVFHFNTKFRGTLNDFKLINLDLLSDKETVVKGTYHFVNAVLQDETFTIGGIVNEVSSSYTQLEVLLPDLLGKHLPSEFKKIGKFKINGTAFLTSKSVDVDVVMDTEVGVVKADLNLINTDHIDDASYKGDINISNFELGKIVQDPLIGKVSFNGKIKGKGFTVANINATINGWITKHQYKGYTYRNAKVNGDFKNKRFNGDLLINDENLVLDFKGLADFSSEINKFDFRAQVDYANFNKLHLFERDSIAVLKGNILMDFEGNTIDDILGKATFTDSSYENEKKVYEFKDFNIKSTLERGIKTIKVNSKDIINGKIKGDFNLSQVHKLVQNSVGSMLANYEPINVAEKQFFEFDFNIYNEIIEVFLPEVNLASNTILKGKVVAENNEIKLLFQAPKLKVSKTVFDSIHLQIDNKNRVNTNFRIKKVNSPNYIVQKVNLLNITLKDTLFFRSDFTGGKENKERFDLSFYYTFDSDKNSVIGFQKSKIRFKNKDWFINQNNDKKNKLVFNFKKQIFDFQLFELSSDKQKINFEGVLRDSTFKDLKVKFDKVGLHGITPKVDSLALDGLVNGNLNFKQEKGVYQPFGTLNIEDFEINEASQGDLEMNLIAEDSYKKYKVDLQLVSNSYKNLNASGYVDLTPKLPVIDLDVHLNAFKLNAFSPLGKNVLTKIRGIADGSFKVTGVLSNPNMDGELKLSNTGLTFPYLNVDYNFTKNQTVELKQQSFIFDDMLLEDSMFGTEGTLSGNISHKGFKDWVLDLKIKSDKLLVLNTEYGEGVSYYGTGLISGEARFQGTTNDLNIGVKATTLKGTKFVIPLSDVRTVENSSLIHFKNESQSTTRDILFDQESLLEKIQGLSLSFELDVTKEAEAEIVIDRISGSSIKGNGSGSLLIEIDTKGKFNMSGDYYIDKGVYNFIFRKAIKKPFEIEKGGVISWDGSPYDADLNLVAIHQVKANPKELLENLNTNRKIDIDLVTKIKGKLFNSTPKFDIIIPNSSSLVASELEFKLNDNDNNTKMRHFFSLLAFKNFYNENNIGANSNSAITGTTSDLISGALSDILNKDDDKFKVGLGYTSGVKNDVEDQNIDDQVDISLATQINDRILINGKLGVPVGSKTQSSVIGEVKVEFLVDEEGNLRWTFFNRQNEVQYSEEEEGYTQGIGLTYQIDFDNFGEMLSKLGFKKKRKKILKKGDKSSIPDDFILVAPSIF